MAPCPNTAKFWKKFLMQHQQIEVFAQWNMLQPHISKQRRNHQTLSSEKRSARKIHTHSIIINYKQFNTMYQNLWVTKIHCFCCHFEPLINFLKIDISHFIYH